MAKKKQAPPIVGELNDKYIVEKSRPLVLMKEVPFALGELKILDTYLSRINARDPAATTVRFSKEEYEDLMGIERMRPERLEKYIKSIMSKTVSIPDATARGGFRVYTLFDEAVCAPDENGQWWIDLSCTTKAKKLFFNIDGIGYIRYQLKNVLPLTSKYSVLLYIYLLDNRFRGSWEIDLAELRESVFRCTQPCYLDYKYFKRDILEKAVAEVNRVTDLTFAYDPVKVGRKVGAIRWRLLKDETALPEPKEELPGQLALAGMEDDEDEESIDSPDEAMGAAFYAGALPPELTLEEVEELVALAGPNVPVDHDVLLPRENRLYDYLRQKTLLLNASKKTIKAKYKWLKKAVAENWT